MNNDPLTCPYCNARQPHRPGLAVGQKIVCARCGDAFVLPEMPVSETSTGITTSPNAPGAHATATAVSAVPRPARPVRANRLVGGIVLGVMAIMAGAGLTYALKTVDVRRDHDRELPRKPRRLYDLISPHPIPGDVVSPGQLAGLGYLPRQTNLLACVQVQELLASPAGKEWRSQPLKFGNTAVSLNAVREWTGLPLEDIDHVLLGVVIRDLPEADLTPPVHLVVRTRKRYDSKRIKDALKAQRGKEMPTPEGPLRTVYSATVRNLPMSLWLADERTFVMGLFNQLEQVPGKPHEGLSRLPGEVRELITKRLSAGVPAWVLGHASDWKKTWLPTVAASFQNVPLMTRLEQVSSFALWLVPQKPPLLQGAFRCVDEKLARKIAEADLSPRQKAHPERFKFSRDGGWLDVQVKLEAGRVD